MKGHPECTKHAVHHNFCCERLNQQRSMFIELSNLSSKAVLNEVTGYITKPNIIRRIATGRTTYTKSWELCIYLISFSVLFL